MFYSESLLLKSGPLARVWLASNLDRKLNKNQVLQSNLQNNVRDIIGEDAAPIALRMSGQLLLGVVKIYNRKAKYLMDDCSEALLKIKMAFRPGNVDLPTDQSHKANPTALMLPDTITELDLFAPLPDPDDILREPEQRAPGQDPTLLDFGISQIVDSQTPNRSLQRRLLHLDDDNLDLDLGLDPADDPVRSTPMSDGPSIEQGRRAPTVQRDEPTLLEDDLALDLGDYGGETTTFGRGSPFGSPPADQDAPMPLDSGHPPPHRRRRRRGDDNDNDDEEEENENSDENEDDDTTIQQINMDETHKNTNNGDLTMGGMDNDEIGAANDAALKRAAQFAEDRLRDNESPLSSVRSSVERDLEETFRLDQAGLHDEVTDANIMQAAQRVKRRKVMRMDNETELHNSQIKRQQEDRSAITKAPSFLPRDPLLLQLLELQRNGSFVSHLMGDGRMQGWAPELRGILSLEVVRKAGDKKRKRDSGIAELDRDERDPASPQLELPLDDFDMSVGGGGGGGPDMISRSASLLMSDQAPPRIDEGELSDHDHDHDHDHEAYGESAANFDLTEAPLLHPSQSGAISLGTKKMVHLLRDHFAPEHPHTAHAPPTPSKRVKSSCLFTDLCPEEHTSRQDATQMFFELLVLGTKDAIKVEQAGSSPALPIRVRGKRGLWGNWTEVQTTATTTDVDAVDAPARPATPDDFDPVVTHDLLPTTPVPTEITPPPLLAAAAASAHDPVSVVGAPVSITTPTTLILQTDSD